MTTINGYIERLKSINAEEIAAAAMDENGDAISQDIREWWDRGVTPSGENFRALWAGADASTNYRKNYKIRSGNIYHYRFINISGATRAYLNVKNGKISSSVEYWGNILKRFKEVSQNPIDYSEVSQNYWMKKQIKASFIRIWTTHR